METIVSKFITKTADSHEQRDHDFIARLCYALSWK